MNNAAVYKTIAIHSNARASMSKLHTAALIIALLLLDCGHNVFANEQYAHVLNQTPVNGFITQLLVDPLNRHRLLAIASPDGKPIAGGRYGLYIFDISNPLRARELAYYKLQHPTRLALENGYAFVLDTYFQGQEESGEYGIHILKVSEEPTEIQRVGRIQADAFKMHLSQDGRLLFFEERSLRPESKKGLQIYDVSKPWDEKPLTSIQLPSRVFGFTTAAEGKILIVRDMIDNVLTFDVSNPATPKQLLKQPFKPFGSEMFAQGNRIYTNDSSQLGIYDVADTIKEVGIFQPTNSTSAPFVSGDGRMVLLPSGKSIQYIDSSDPAKTRQIAKFPVPNYAGSVVAIHSNGRPLFLAGLLGSLAVIDPYKAGTTAESLAKAHDRALKRFADTHDAYATSMRANDSAEILEAAGIAAALKKKPQGLPDRKYAHILNDYAFFLMEYPQRLEEAITALRLTVKADPARAVAYLNLGDALRKHLAQAKSYEQKKVSTKEIKRAYIDYKRLSGKTTPMIDSFLRFNILDSPKATACDHIAAFVNKGRFEEILGSGSREYGDSTLVDLNGDGTPERVQITYEGTAHYPYLQAFNLSTGSSIEIAEPDKDFNGAWADFIGLVPFEGQTYVLHYNMGGYPVLLSEISQNFEERTACRFVSEPIEAIGEASEDKKLCRVLLEKGHPPYLALTEGHSLDNQTANFIEASPGKVGMVEINNDGTEVPILAVQYASGAGSGCDYNYFDLLNHERTALALGPARDLLMKMQGMGHEHSRHPVPACRGNATGWFHLNGITYFETKFPGDHANDLLTAFHNVSFIKENRIHKTCEFVFAPKTRVQ